MALVNVAAELVRRGRKVLVVDFDLEAPGLETYKHLHPPKPHPGIVEYVTEFRRTNEVPNLLDPDEPYIYEATKARPIGKKGGRLWVMPAGRRDKAYRNALVDLDWQQLYAKQHGFLLFEDTKKGWEVELKPEYVLIDSRTGDTDVLGICTRQLPDAVVMMFTPNEQNLAGLENVCRDIRCEKTRLEKPIKLHFVASNVPNQDDEDHHLRKHLGRFRKKLAISDDTPIPIIHRNETLQLLNQPVFVLDRPHSWLAGEYRALVRVLQVENLEDRVSALVFLREIQKERSWNVGHVIPEDANHLKGVTFQFWSDAKVLFRVGEYLLRYREPSMALKRLNRVLELDPDFGDALFERALCHRMLRDDAAAAEDLFHYLRDHGTRSEKNESALLELLSISLDEFLKTLDLPPVKVSIFCRDSHDSHAGLWLLSKISVRLIQERRWDEAIRCFEHRKVKELIESGNRLDLPTWKPLHAFHLAMAHWGKAGEPRRKYCVQALRAYEPIMDYNPFSSMLGDEEDPYDCSSFKFYGSWFQDLSLLYWGAGDTQKAEEALGKALAGLGEPGDLVFDLGVSSWTFRETTVLEYRKDCEEIRRMIHGERVRPAFLGPQR